MQIKNRTIREARSPLPAEFPNIIGPIIVFIYRGTLYPTYYPRKSKLRSRTSPLYSRLSLFLRVEPRTSVMGGLTPWARDQTKVNDRFEPVFTHPHPPPLSSSFACAFRPGCACTSISSQPFSLLSSFNGANRRGGSSWKINQRNNESIESEIESVI